MSWWRRQYIGTVTGHTVHMDGEKEVRHTRVTWILTIRPFGLGRSARQIGEASPLGVSKQHQNAEARVKVWLHGGPLPPLDADTQERKPAPVIRLASNRETER